MNCIAVKEAKNNFTQLLHIVENGEPVQISRHGKTVAVLSSLSNFEETIKSSSFAESFREWQEKYHSISKDSADTSNFSNEEIEQIFKSERKIENLCRAQDMEV